MRNRRLKRGSGDFLEYYGKVVDATAAKDPSRAVGSDTIENWEKVGQLQFNYLLRHGLRPEHRFLDIGCGNIRAGRHFITHLNPGHYIGIDISPKVLADALKQIVRYGLESKLPYLYYIDTTDYSCFPAEYFDVVQAHSVFSHLPIDQISQVLSSVRRVLKPGGFFDFTFIPSQTGKPGNYINEDYYYPADTLIEAVRRVDLEPRKMDDWEYPQHKIRAYRRGSPT